LEFEEKAELVITGYPNLEEIVTTGKKDVENISKVTINNCSQLKEINISNTDINSGVEFLPNSLEKINYSFEKRQDSKVKEIKEQIDSLLTKK